MNPESEFYQISGYRAHSNGWFKMYDDKPMIQEIIGMKSKLFRPGGQDSPVELVLGILPSGASYLLMTSEQMHTFTHKHRLRIPRKPWLARDFLSLSPIHFHDHQDLSTKVATYKQRPRNKSRRELEEPVDNSQANRGYVQAGSNDVHYRAYFEQQRVLYRLLTRELEPGKVGLALPPWLDRVRVVSLVFEEWLADERPRRDRLKDVWLVHVGWADVTFPSFFEQLACTPVHVEIKSSGKHNPNSKKAHFSEVVALDQAGCNERLRSLLSPNANESGVPLIVIVHNEDMARAVLSRTGIDLESWSSGLSNLLSSPTLASAKNRCKAEEDAIDEAAFPPPSIVNLQKLVKAVMETNSGITVPHSAKVLRMQMDTKTCAGDDSLLQLRMWTSMAQGLAIDEQHRQRKEHQPECADLLAPPPMFANADADVDPDDVDPNDMASAPPRPLIEDDDDDDEW